MSDHDSKRDEGRAGVAKAANDVGSGARSLTNWQRLAAAREGNESPNALLASYGIDAAALGSSPTMSSLERRLAFAGEVERDTLGVHRAVSLVVGPVALAVAGVAAVAGAVVGNVAAAVNAAYAANAAYSANVVWTTNWVSG